MISARASATQPSEKVVIAMPELPNDLAATVMLILPWPPITVGLGISLIAYRYTRWTKALTTASTWVALMAAIVALGFYLLGNSGSETLFSIPLPMWLGSIAINVEVNGLTVLMLVLVALVGVVVARFSSTYLHGDKREGSFHGWLSLVLGSFFMLISAGNMWEFVVFWIATSLGVHQLLVFYRDRPIAVLAARKQYLLHRLADATLITAFVLISQALHTSNFSRIGLALARAHGAMPMGLQIASGLLVVTAVLKSAQFPFHGWLVQVMEAPTPVSALLHAGVIYTGTFLLLRMVPIMSRVLWASDTLVVMSLIAIVVASLMMMTMTNIKGFLAYSTSAQMGFMLLECGLGLYSLALLHIVSHSVYKAHAFLSSGSVVDYHRSPTLPTGPRAVSMGKIIGTVLLAIAGVIGIGSAFGAPMFDNGALVVMGIVLATAVSQLLMQSFTLDPSGTGALAWMGLGLSALISTAYFGLGILFTHLSQGVLPTPLSARGLVHEGLVGLVAMVFIGLWWLRQMLPRVRESRLGWAIYVHLYNDLYLDVMFTRLVRRFWPGQARDLLCASMLDDQWGEAV